MTVLPRFISKLFAASVLAISSVFAGVPSTLNYQGTLTDSAERPVTGDKDITFRLYAVPTGGTAFWTGTQKVTVRDGRLSAVLGGNTAANPPIDPKKFTGETYISLQVAPDNTEMPRQKFTSVAYAFTSGTASNVTVIPRGVIVMWSGAVADIPAGWALCDGNPANGTPDLRDKFVIGAGSAYAPTDKGGVASNDIGSHSHQLSINIAESGLHVHSVSGATTGISGFDSWPKLRKDSDENYMGHNHTISGSTDQQGSHTHAASGSTTASDPITFNNLPPYYALAFIMKL